MCVPYFSCPKCGGTNVVGTITKSYCPDCDHPFRIGSDTVMPPTNNHQHNCRIKPVKAKAKGEVTQ